MNTRLLLGGACATLLFIFPVASAWAASPDMGTNSPTTASSETVTVKKDQQTDPCMVVASAKYGQWSQPRFLIHRTEIFADGSKKEIEAIFTADAAYGHEIGLPWQTQNLVRKARAPAAPDALVKNMGLARCQFAGAAGDMKQPASLYTYGYVPDSNANQATGKMWIADGSDLPLRQELAQEKETSRKAPVAISATFAYNDDVQIPKDAIQSDNLRRWLAQQGLLFNTQIAVGGGGPSLAGSPHGGRR